MFQELHKGEKKKTTETITEKKNNSSITYRHSIYATFTKGHN